MMLSQFIQIRFVAKALCLISVLSLGCIGCGTSYVVTPTQGTGDYSFDDFNSEIKGKDASIIMRDKKELSGTNIQIRGDSIAWVEVVYKPNPDALLPRTRLEDVPRSVSVTEVERVIRKNAILGGLEGLGLGLVGGGLLGMGIGSAGTSGSKDDFGPLIGLVVGGAVGAVGGTVTGAIIGHSYDYEFVLREPVEKQPK